MFAKFKSAIVWIVVFELIGFLLGRLTQEGMVTWYQTLYKSCLTPPAIVFPIVWTILYSMIALAGWSLWQSRQQPRAKLALLIYGAQLLMNWAWTPIFFYFHWISLSFYWIVGIATLTLLIIIITKDRFKFCCIMLLPYLYWVIFASYLNGVIWALNVH